MDQKRLLLAIALSVAILLGFQLLMPKRPVPPPGSVPVAQTTQPATTTPPPGTPAVSLPPAQSQPDPAMLAAEKAAPRVSFTAARVQGSINLLGAKLDDLVLRDYRETVDPTSPQVRLLAPRTDKQPYYVQFGWSAGENAGIRLPANDTLWTAEGTLSATTPLTLNWDNGAGLVFQLIFTVDQNFMFSVQQKVINNTGAPVSVYPYSRIRREYEPDSTAYYVLHEGMVGNLAGKLYDYDVLGFGNGDYTFAGVKSAAEKANGVALDRKNVAGWAGITDKYWLISLITDNDAKQNARFEHFSTNGGTYQVDFLTTDAETVPAGGSAAQKMRLFAGAKEVHLLDAYSDKENIANFDKAVDFGMFYFITKPFFFAIDYLNGLLGNFGLAIIAFTLGLKLLFFPLANKSYRSMSKMKLLNPKIQALREQYKDDSAKLQSAMMQLYKTEKVNPASGCLPMLLQIPVFFSLYKVIFVTIEMRQAPFFGWIHDLSAVDPTNVFNLFGLIPFDPSIYSNYLHLGAWPLLMGATMYFQQKLNPPPPDPTQAKLFQFMPIIFTFMLSNFPAGLVIYWSWNNTLTILQQTIIMRQTRLSTAKETARAVQS